MTCIILIGVCSFLTLKTIMEGDSPVNGFKYMSPTGNVRFDSNNAGTAEIVYPTWNNGMSLRHLSSPSIPTAGSYHAEYRNTAFSVQNSDFGKLYSTASISPYSYGGGGNVAESYGRNSKSDNRKYNANNSFVGNIHTFVAMSSPVRSSAEEFEYGENAIGADNPHAVIRRTPGSGPVTDDPGHTPTVVGTTPIGEGVCFMIVLAIGYVIRHQYKVRKQEIK